MCLYHRVCRYYWREQRLFLGLPLCVCPAFTVFGLSVIKWKHSHSTWPRHPNHFRRCFQMREWGPALPWCMTSPRKFSPTFIFRWKVWGENDLVLRRQRFHSDILHSNTAVQIHVWLCALFFNHLLFLNVSCLVCFRLTNSSLRRRCGRWTTYTLRQRSWEASHTLKVVWLASLLTWSSCVWRLTMRRWETFSPLQFWQKSNIGNILEMLLINFAWVYFTFLCFVKNVSILNTTQSNTKISAIGSYWKIYGWICGLTFTLNQCPPLCFLLFLIQEACN